MPDSMANRICYTRDCGPSPGGIPGYVVRPTSAEEVSGILQLANQHRTPVFVWGRSATFLGNGIQEGCILMALDLMDQMSCLPEAVPADAELAAQPDRGDGYHRADLETTGPAGGAVAGL